MLSVKLVKYPGVTLVIFVHGDWGENLLTSSFLCLWNANLAVGHEASVKASPSVAGPKQAHAMQSHVLQATATGREVTQEGEPVDGGHWHTVIKAHTPPTTTTREITFVSACVWETSSSFSAVYLQQLRETKKNISPKIDKVLQWKVGWAWWCQWSLIKCACGWKRNECLVFALCPPQAAAPPEALYIFRTLFPLTHYGCEASRSLLPHLTYVLKGPPIYF